MNKFCTVCDSNLPLDCFGVNRKQKDGRNTICKKCNVKKVLQWKAKNPEKVKITVRKYHETHKDLLKKANNTWRAKNHERYRKYVNDYNKSIVGRYHAYKSSAKLKNRVFELSLEDFMKISLNPCFYCGEFSPNKQYCRC